MLTIKPAGRRRPSPGRNSSAALTEHSAKYFRQLEAEFTDDEEDTFRLDQHGPFILLGADDAGNGFPAFNPIFRRHL